MESLQEIWQPVQEREGYSVSNLGRVRSMPRTIERRNGSPYRVKERMLAISRLPSGYCFVTLYGSGGSQQLYVHRLVARAFIGPCPDGMEVNHKDGDKDNNAVGNLEYSTHADNMAHAKTTGLIDFDGENNPYMKYTGDQIRQGHALVTTGSTYRQAAATVGINQDALEAACRGQNWKSLGLTPIRRAALNP